jgi:hypothetical protein
MKGLMERDFEEVIFESLSAARVCEPVRLSEPGDFMR